MPDGASTQPHMIRAARESTFESRPKLRGVLHQWAAATSLGAGAVLVTMAPTKRSMLAAAIYAFSLIALFTVSATYHRVKWSPRARGWMRRLDHSAIFVLIAGTYTPIALVALDASVATRVLTIVWIGATLGILKALFWSRGPKAVMTVLCIALGWSASPYFGEMGLALRTSGLSLLLGGGLAYMIGGLAYAAQRPNFKPGIFGYHELFHALTIVGAAMHFALVLRILR